MPTGVRRVSLRLTVISFSKERLIWTKFTYYLMLLLQFNLEIICISLVAKLRTIWANQLYCATSEAKLNLASWRIWMWVDTLTRLYLSIQIRLLSWEELVKNQDSTAIRLPWILVRYTILIKTPGNHFLQWFTNDILIFPLLLMVDLFTLDSEVQAKPL